MICDFCYLIEAT